MISGRKEIIRRASSSLPLAFPYVCSPLVFSSAALNGYMIVTAGTTTYVQFKVYSDPSMDDQFFLLAKAPLPASQLTASGSTQPVGPYTVYNFAPGTYYYWLVVYLDDPRYGRLYYYGSTKTFIIRTDTVEVATDPPTYGESTPRYNQENKGYHIIGTSLTLLLLHGLVLCASSFLVLSR